MALYSKGLQAFRYKVPFKKPSIVELPNGDVKQDFVTEFTRHAALHTASGRYLATLDGFNRTTDIVIAIRSVFNDPIDVGMDYNVYVLTFKGLDYIIRQIDPDDKGDVSGYHLLYLRRKDYAN